MTSLQEAIHCFVEIREIVEDLIDRTRTVANATPIDVLDDLQ